MIMKRKTTMGAVAGAFLMASAPLWAQDATTVDPDVGNQAGQNAAGAMSGDDIATLRAQIQALQDRLDKMEAGQKTAMEAAAKTSPVTTKEKVVLSGLLQVHGLGFVSEDERTGGRKGNDTIRLRRGELRLTAPSITDRVSGTIMFDPAKAVSGTTNIANNQNINIRARDNVLQEMVVTYQLGKLGDKANNTFIDIGQYKIPIGYESLVSASSLQTVERALLFTQRDPFDGGYGDVRDSGIQVRGLVSNQLDYRVGIFNGLGELQNTTAVSDQKAVIGRLAYSPTGVPGLQVGVSGATARNATPSSNGARPDRNIFNLFAVYKRNKATFQSEYLTGKQQLQSMATNTEIQGYYASLGYLFTPKLEGVLRYDSLDTNRNVDNAKVKDITLGLNYYLKGNTKIQANIVHRNSDQGAPSSLRNDRTELRTNFQVAF